MVPPFDHRPTIGVFERPQQASKGVTSRKPRGLRFRVGRMNAWIIGSDALAIYEAKGNEPAGRARGLLAAHA